MNALLKDLNEAQKKAVLTTEGPVMAIAGAGSGKTRVLTRRMAHLISDIGVPKENILAITFTNKAANEMKHRVHSLLGIKTRDMWVSTFHAMCARILRDHIDRLGYDKRFQIIDDDDTKQMIKVMIKRLGYDPKIVKPQVIKKYVLNLKFDTSLVEAYPEPLKTYVSRIFPAYQSELRSNNLVDFEDLLVLTIELLRDHKDIREHYQKLFQYILVDEFQDTNNVQYELINLLSNDRHNIFIVGDEDQSIYAFRGANIANIQKFERDYKDVERILLEENYRSTNHILKAANDVIKCNKNRIDKTLFSSKGDGDKVTLFKGYTYRDETEYVAQTIHKLVREKYRYEDIAVLYRANATSRTFEDIFMQKNIPYQVVGNMSFFKRKEIKDMVAYLRLILNSNDDYSFTRVVNEPKRGIGAKTIDDLTTFADQEDLSLYEAIDHDANPLRGAAINKLKTFKNMIEKFKEDLFLLDFNQFMDEIVNKSGYKKMLEHDDMGDVRYENIQELKTMLKENKQVFDDADKIDLLTYVLEEIALKSQDEDTTDSNVVTLMTLHAAKGLEFDVVFLVAVEQGMFPLYRSLETENDLAEERRLMYVGMTRAKEKLYITNARQRQLYGELTMNHDSQFIKEINPKYLDKQGLHEQVPSFLKHTPTRQPKKDVSPYDFETNENDLEKGDKINHKTFGKGVVITVQGDQCTIAFGKEYGIKTLLKNHAAIEKL
ncbi:MAG: ATP-dependent helicase [Bacillota bacterium]